MEVEWDWRKLAGLVEASVPSAGSDVRGASETEIERLARAFGQPLPTHYVEFLRWMGGEMGSLVPLVPERSGVSVVADWYERPDFPNRPDRERFLVFAVQPSDRPDTYPEHWAMRLASSVEAPVEIVDCLAGPPERPLQFDEIQPWGIYFHEYIGACAARTALIAPRSERRRLAVGSAGGHEPVMPIAVSMLGKMGFEPQLGETPGLYVGAQGPVSVVVTTDASVRPPNDFEQVTVEVAADLLEDTLYVREVMAAELIVHLDRALV